MEAKYLRVAMVTPVKVSDKSSERLVRFTNGTETTCYVTQWGGDEVGREPDDVDSETCAALKSAASGAGAADQLCRRAATAAGVNVERRFRFNHRCTPTRHTVSVRISGSEAHALLRASGVYWAVPSFIEGNELHPVIWLKEEATLKQAMQIASHADALGVAAARRRYGLRYPASNQAARKTLRSE
ncbi:hypothetical protein DIPPA_31816 [Diplonema papillatum]|nr:hypothetical protein DIPPA_31816 [Diplonema papillatum]